MGFTTMHGLVDDQAHKYQEKPAVHYGPEDITVSYRELNEKANRIGNGLRAEGLACQERVAVLFRNPMQTVFAMCGINKAGCIYAPINFEYKGETLTYQINDSAPQALLLEDRYIGRLNAIREKIPTDFDIYVLETDADTATLDNIFTQKPFETLLNAPKTTPDVSVSADDAAGIVYTSGTTGDPKGAVIPHRWITENTILARSLTVDETDVFHTSIPLYHMAGAYFDFVSAISVGASIALWNRFSVSEFWDRISKYNATTTLLVSAMQSWLMSQLEQPDDTDNTLHTVRMQPLPENYNEITSRFGIDFVLTGYGSTEAGFPFAGLIDTRREGSGERVGKPAKAVINEFKQVGFPVVDTVPGDGYMGKPAPYIKAIPVDESGYKVQAGDIGELCLRPKEPGVLFREYLGKPEANLDAFRNLWFHTGDMVRYDECGGFYFVDRKDDVIRRRGENISTSQVESIVGEHNAVGQAAAFPVESDDGDDAVAIAVEILDGQNLGEDSLRTYLAEQMPEYMLPEYITFVDEMPTTETSKVEKYKLRKRLEESDVDEES